MSSYPSARRCVDELINERQVTITTGDQVVQRTIKVYFTLPGSFADQLPHEVPVLVYTLPGTATSIDRTDRVGVDVYAHGTDAEDVAEAIREWLVNDDMPHYLTAGYVDGIRSETLPGDVPYVTPGVFQAQAIYRVTTRHQ